MKTIYKYAIEPGERQMIMAPWDAKVLYVGSQLAGTVHFWVELDVNAEDLIERTFVVHNTGAAVPDHHKHIGSAWASPNMWHLYEVYLPSTDVELEREEELERDQAAEASAASA